MKTYKSSDLTHKRAEVLKEAKANGVIIQECNTNGDVRCEYVIILKEDRDDMYYCSEKYLHAVKGCFMSDLQNDIQALILVGEFLETIKKENHN